MVRTGVRAKVLEGGRIKWIGRKLRPREKGGPMLVLPSELKSWGGMMVEIELLSERELIVRLMEEEGKEVESH